MHHSPSYDNELAQTLGSLPQLDLNDIPATRAMLAELQRALPPYQPGPGVTHRQTEVPCADGRPPVPLHILAPNRDDTPMPALMWLHGGGFVLGNATESLPFLDEIVRATGAMCLSVGYRLAPEAPFPAALEDAAAALDWLCRQAAGLGVDPARIAIGGQSAGGALAAGLALSHRDRGGPPLCLQLLDNPVTDDRLATASIRQGDATPMWDKHCATLSWRAYLGGATDVSPYAAPARAEDLTTLPPAYVSLAQHDPLRDEGLEYGRRLAEAGIPTEMQLYPGTFHASASLMPGAAVSRRQGEDLRQALKRAFGATT